MPAREGGGGEEEAEGEGERRKERRKKEVAAVARIERLEEVANRIEGVYRLGSGGAKVRTAGRGGSQGELQLRDGTTSVVAEAVVRNDLRYVGLLRTRDPVQSSPV